MGYILISATEIMPTKQAREVIKNKILGSTMKQNTRFIPTALSVAIISATIFVSTGANAGRPTVENVLPLTHTCSSTLKFRAQDMTQAQFDDSCAQVGAEEGYFHSRLETNELPVSNDLNEDLLMVIFDDYSQYNRYGSRLFGINTDNGGMYIEGDATDSANQAAFYAHEADWLRPEFQIWNLKHEYVHYLDGRFNLKGNFSDYPSSTVWWSEGLGEYISLEDVNPEAVALVNASGGNRTLSEVFNTSYNNTSDEIYRWGYLGVRFMFENHMDDIRTQRITQRASDWSTYQSNLNGWGATYEQEWQNWLIALAGGTTDPTDPTDPTTEVLLDTTATAAARTWSYFDVTPQATGSLTITITGGTGDADLYVKAGSQPSSSAYDCRPYINGNEESCQITVPASNTYHIGLYAYQAFENVTVTATYSN
jgi:microbial collagenase